MSECAGVSVDESMRAIRETLRAQELLLAMRTHGFASFLRMNYQYTHSPSLRVHSINTYFNQLSHTVRPSALRPRVECTHARRWTRTHVFTAIESALPARVHSCAREDTCAMRRGWRWRGRRNVRSHRVQPSAEISTRPTKNRPDALDRIRIASCACASDWPAASRPARSRLVCVLVMHTRAICVFNFDRRANAITLTQIYTRIC